MQLEQIIKRCSELLYKLCENVQRLNSLNYYDINISSENFFIHLLNLIFGWNLKNENFTRRNTAAIDLTDDDNRIAIQVTSNDSAEKIRNTIKKFREDKLYERYDRLIVVVIKKRKSYTAEFGSVLQGKFAFDKKKDIFTIDELIHKIQEIGYRKAAEVCEYLEFQIGTVMDRKRVQTIESAFQEICENTNGYMNEDFFEVDDYRFKKAFEEALKGSAEIHVNGTNKEETLYCILNQVHQMVRDKETYIFRDADSWNAAKDRLEDSIVIPFFEAEQIPVLHGNTNIFIYGTGTHQKCGIELRRRTRSFLTEKLRNNGCEDAYNLVQQTNGIYFYLKKELFKGQLASPLWGQDKHIAVITAVLAGSWCKIDGDLQVLEAISGIQYSELSSYLEKYIGIEMPLILKKTSRDRVYYEITDPEIAWYEIKESITQEQCNKFLTQARKVISDKSYVYSGLLKKGMIRTMIFLALYNQQQSAVDRLVGDVLSEVQDAETWCYFANYMVELCEVSPESIISRLQEGLHDNTGMLELFEEKSSNYLWGSSNYTRILWAVEMLLEQNKFAARAVRWLMELSDKVAECSLSNNPRETLSKVFCTWYNAVELKVEEKIYLAEEGLNKYSYLWNILYEKINRRTGGIIIPNQEFTYRKKADLVREPEWSEMLQLDTAYFNLLLSHTHSTEQWIKMIRLFPDITDEMLDTSVAALEKDIEAMRDSERESVQYGLREIVYSHRQHNQADWAADESRIARIEFLCNNISFRDEYYEFLYITRNEYFPIFNPSPYSQENYNRSFKEDDEKRKIVLQEEFARFKEKRLDLQHLLQFIDANVSYEFCYAIAEFYSGGKYDEEIMKKMLAVPHVEKVISLYVRWCYCNDNKEILVPALSLVDGYDENNVLFYSVLGIPKLNEELIKMVDKMSPEKQRGYWTTSFHIDNLSSPDLLDYVIAKLFEYRLWGKILDAVYFFKEKMSVDAVLENMVRIIHHINHEKSVVDSDMTDWKIEKIIDYMENLISGDYEQYPQLFEIEINWMPVIGWDRSKCVQYYMKREARLFADIINLAYRNEDSKSPTEYNIENHLTYHRILNTIRFCPGENDGHIDRGALEHWIGEFQSCLERQNQSSLLYSELGRLFTYSPVGTDGIAPHEVVRDMIERFNNHELENSYFFTTLNKRGMHVVTSGEAEHKMASDYRDIASKLRVRWPKTAEIYDRLADEYESQSIFERQEAENYY